MGSAVPAAFRTRKGERAGSRDNKRSATLQRARTHICRRQSDAHGGGHAIPFQPSQPEQASPDGCHPHPSKAWGKAPAACKSACSVHAVGVSRMIGGAAHSENEHVEQDNYDEGHAHQPENDTFHLEKSVLLPLERKRGMRETVPPLVRSSNRRPVDRRVLLRSQTCPATRRLPPERLSICVPASCPKASATGIAPSEGSEPYKSRRRWPPRRSSGERRLEGGRRTARA